MEISFGVIPGPLARHGFSVTTLPPWQSPFVTASKERESIIWKRSGVSPPFRTGYGGSPRLGCFMFGAEADQV